MRELPLADVLEVLIDHRGRTPKKLGGDFVVNGVPVISALLVKRGRLHISEARRISHDMYRKWMPIPIRENDVVLTSEAPLGRCALVRSGDPIALGQRVFGLRPKTEVMDGRFLYYVLQSDLIQERLYGRSSGTTVLGIRQKELVKIRVPVPDLPQQIAVAEVLGALDDKIALNERISRTVSELTRAVMAELWDKADVASLVRGDAGIPDGWRRTTLGTLCATGGGAIQTGPFGSQLHASDYVDSGIPSVMPQNIGDNRIAEDGIARITVADAERLSKYRLMEGDIVYSRRGDVKRRALVRKYEDGWLCGTGCLRVRVGTATEPLFMSYYLGEPEIQEWVAQHAVGATMPNLNTAILGEVPIVLPPVDTVRQVNERLSGLDATAAHLQHENRTLAELRDTLLPQLLSGKLRAKDAVRTVEEAV
ncbi:restriction endonuclease subunit S [Streptomyces sp. NPDC052644]